MSKLSEGMDEHNRKLQAEAEVAQAAQQAAAKKSKEFQEAFDKLLMEVVAPACRDFKVELRKAGRDLQVHNSTKGAPHQVKGFLLHDKHLLGQDAVTEKTLTPSGDLSAEKSNKFFLISKTHETLNIQWRALAHAQPTNGRPISLEEITREKLEELLLEFYMQAYPTGAKQG